MKRSQVVFLSIIGLFLLSFPTDSLAALNCTTTPECQVTGTFGTLGGPTSLLPLGTSKSGFTTIRFPANNYDISVGSDTTITDNLHKNWQFVYMGDAGLTSNVDVNFWGAVLEIDRLILKGTEPRSVGMSQLNLTKVNLDTNTVRLNFQGSDNQINLTNSNVDFTSRDPIFKETAPFAINVLGGDNTFTGFTGRILPSTTSINLQPGSTLNFYGSFSGKLSTDTQTSGLYFGSPVNGTVDNAKLKFQLSNVYVNSSSFNFTNNSQLELKDSGTRVEFENLSIDNSQVIVGGNTSLIINKTLTLSDATATNDTVTLNGASTLDANVVEVIGDSVVSGDTFDSTQFLANILELKDNVSLTQNGANIIAESLFLQSGSVFTVNDGDVQVTDTLAKGGTINLNNSATYSMTRGFAFNDFDLTLNIDSTSRWNVGSKAIMQKGTTTVINNDGQFNLFGELWGNGNFSGSGEVIVKETGQISPGIPGNAEIGIFTFDNTLTFTNQGAQGDQSRSQYLAHIGVVGGIPGSDLLQYNNNNVDTTGLSSIKVETATANSATDLDGETFTIIASKESASTGTIVTGGSYPAIVEGGSIPALVDFSIFDNNTNGNSDITLLADANINNLLKHPSNSTRNRQGSASLLVNAANSGNTAIANSLNTLTNSQVAQHLESVHAEPYSSYMTISLEHTDMVINTVLNHAVRDGVFSTGRSYEATQQRTKKQYWASAGAMDTASDAVQTTQPETLKRAWMDASYNEGDVDGDSGLGDFEYSLFSLTIGQDLVSTDDRTLGAFFSFGTQDMDEHDNAVQDFDGDIYHLGLYMNEADIGGWNLRGVLGYAYGDHDSRRTVVLSNSIATPSAGFDSHSAYVGVKGTVIGYQNDWVTLAPELGLNYTYYKQDSLKESGDPNLSLQVDSEDAQAIIASVGVDARFASLSQTHSIYPMTFVRYEYDAYADNNNDHEVDAALVAHPEYKQTFVGQNRGEHSFIGGFGLGSDLTSALQIRGGLRYTEHSHGNEWGAGMNMQYLW